MGENENLSIDFSELKYLERQLHNLSRLVEINGISIPPSISQSSSPSSWRSSRR